MKTKDKPKPGQDRHDNSLSRVRGLVATPTHRGDFIIKDEIYWGFRVGPEVTPLITTTHPKSGKPLGWCRTEGKSRVVYLQLGHGSSAYTNPNYQKLVAPEHPLGDETLTRG